MKNWGIRKNFGFGCMRLPMNGDVVDNAEMCRMVDAFIERGFNYFDTAHGYLDGKSEIALKECLTSRYPRDAYLLVDKLSIDFFKSNEEIRPLFESQLEACGVDYFDLYLMHCQTATIYKKFKEYRAYEKGLEFLAEGKIRHFGISFHDKAEVLDEILTEYPQIEVVQIQFNYADYEDKSVESRKCYEVCRRHGKPIIVMEPVKGGALVNLPADAQAILDNLGGGSAASFEGIEMVLSGMGSMAMMEDNLSTMLDFKPLNADEFAAIDKVCDILHSIDLIPCTGCRYCVSHCPQNLAIPELFACMNEKKQWDNNMSVYYYKNIHTVGGRTASSCLACGACVEACPQHLEIPSLMKDVAEAFDKE